MKKCVENYSSISDDIARVRALQEYNDARHDDVIGRVAYRFYNEVTELISLGDFDTVIPNEWYDDTQVFILGLDLPPLYVEYFCERKKDRAITNIRRVLLFAPSYIIKDFVSLPRKWLENYEKRLNHEAQELNALEEILGGIE